MPFRLRLALLVGLLTIVGAFLAVSIQSSPVSFAGHDWILGEAGNQLYRADLPARDLHLYRDVVTQYGPLPIFLSQTVAHFIGNTVAVHLLIQSSLTLVVVGAVFWLATTGTIRRDASVLVTIAVAVVACADTPLWPVLLAVPTAYAGVSVERLCLLALMALWRPPDRRHSRHAVYAAIVVLVWQCVKPGGAVFGVAAFALVDGLWLARGGGGDGKVLARWWRSVAWGAAVGEAIRCGAFIGFVGWDEGLRAAWPFYVVSE